MSSPLRQLETMGHALGGLRHVQGPGGNVSVKVDDVLWVKASGTRLVDVASESGHAQVPLHVARAALAGDAAADAELFARTPRPSLETYFHALPAAVIAHTHPVGVHLYACSTDTAPPTLDVPVREIPYVRPGIGVARAIEAVLDPDADAQIVVLRSHGVVVFAPSASRAVELTVRFDEAVRAAFGELPPFEAQVHAYLLLGERRDLIGGGVVQEIPRRASNATSTTPPRYLFPDAPVCASTVLVDELDDVAGLAVRALAAMKRAGILVDADGRRAAFARSAEQLVQTIEVLAAHDWVEDLLVARGTARYLPDDEPEQILGMPSEQYRIRLAATT